jgi:membrane protein YqaA with SNARE-associated domain
MKATTVLDWMKNRPLYSLAILLGAASGYAIDRWFFSGLMASKWIGLPQYASAMKELQNESRNWGIVVVVLEIATLALVLPAGRKWK